MKKINYQNFLKLFTFSFIVLLIVSAFILRNTVSANTNSKSLEVVEKSLSTDSASAIQDERVRRILGSPIFTDFADWVEQYQSGYFRDDAGQLRRGENLGGERSELFKELITIAPEIALKYAISDETKNDLPLAIAGKLERRISAYGDLIVYGVDQISQSGEKFEGGRIEREAVIGNARYKAFVYGRRESMTTKLQIPLQGVVLDNVMAVDENPLREINPAEYSQLNIDSEKVGERGAAVETGGELIYFSDRQQLEIYVKELIEWESQIGPVRPDKGRVNEPALSPWTEGVKTFLIIRVDFPDRPGEPVDVSGVPLTQTGATNLINNNVSPYFVTNSYNKTSLQPTVTPVVRLPQPQSFYGQGGGLGNYTALLADARDAARLAGYETNTFNFDAVAYTNIPTMDFAGLGYIGGKGLWLNGYFNQGVFDHELGHNYGLLHANLWRTTDGTVTGQGANQEYGDVFDMMGNGGGDGVGHFNAHYKRRLDWLTDANVRTVTSNGVYRITAQDNTTTGGIRALKVKKNSTKNYWIEFRQQFTTNPNAMNGAIIRWDYSSLNFSETQLLDMTPNTSTNATDAPLVIGQSFTDNENHIKFTVLGKGNTTPESLDVRVELNVGCTFSFGQTSQTISSTGGEGTFTVTTQSGCNPIATSNQNWLNLLSSTESAGTYTYRYLVSANYGAQRNGTVNISGQTFTVTQSAPVTACAVPPSGMVAWWRGEANALDETGVNNGSVGSGMSFSAAKIGGGFRGNGTNSFSNKVLIPDSPSLALNRSLSIEGWLRLDSVGNYAIIVRSDDRDWNGSYVIYSFSGGLLFQIKSAPNGASASISSSTTLPIGQFVHIAATLDDATGQMKLYLNGNLVGQTTTTVRPYGNLDPTRNPGIAIGNLNGNLVYDAFNGAVDELAVYNRAITATDVQAIYNAGAATSGSAGKCLLINRRAPFDFDGDAKTDIGIFRPAPAEWWINHSSSNQTVAAQFGTSSDKIVPADFTGDGKTDIAFWRESSGQWFIIRSEDSSFFAFPFGSPGDIPVPADYDGDGKTDAAVFRESNLTWYIQKSSGGIDYIGFGAAGDKPVVADYDGDGKADIAITRINGGVREWWLRRSSDGQITALGFGEASDKAVTGDYTGDGKTDIAIWRPANGFWYILRSEDNSFYAFPFGSSGDIATPGDYDGDGKTDAAVFRPSNATWYLQRSTSGFTAIAFGITGDQAIPNVFVR